MTYLRATARNSVSRDELNLLLVPIRQRFYDNLEIRILRLENASAQLHNDPWSPDALEIVQRDCHKLAGVAPTLGFETVGRLAYEIEVALLSKRDFWPDVARILERLMSELEDHLDSQA